MPRGTLVQSYPPTMLCNFKAEHAPVKMDQHASPTKLFAKTEMFGERTKKVEHVPVTGSDVGDDSPIVELGFIDAAVRAYNQHHGLVWRPDDVWQAIVTQLSFYIQKNAEALRARFVDHDGQKELVVRSYGTLFTAPWGDIAKLFLKEIEKNMKDPSVTAWITPDFTTTTDTDRVGASIAAMATFQAYFSFTCQLMCMLPSVKLLGTEEDWLKLAERIKRIPEFDAGDGRLKEWAEMLGPVIDEIVATKLGKANMDWWQRIANYEGGGSGPTYISGWITVFAVFSYSGEWQGHQREIDDWGKKVTSDWPIIDTHDVPNGVLVVPVKIDDNGAALYSGLLVAGQVASNVVGDGTKLAPRTDWALYVPKEELSQ